MKTNANSRYTVAVLIDGDNASFERMEDIMGFVSRYGDAVVRRIYGDWTRKALSAWKESAREHGFRLVQASSHVPGKNTTDIALVIDAMDILRDGQVDCFCLVASDGDYSLLAQRIREAGVKVLGYGEGKTRCHWYGPVPYSCMPTGRKARQRRTLPNFLSEGIWSISTRLLSRRLTAKKRFPFH